MDQQNDFAFRQIQSCRGGRVEDLVHVLHFEKMISRAERSKLRLTSQLRLWAYRVRIRSDNAATILGVVEVRFGTHSMFDRPARTLFENLVQIGVGYAETARLAGARRNVAKELMHEITQPGFDLFER